MHVWKWVNYLAGNWRDPVRYRRETDLKIDGDLDRYRVGIFGVKLAPRWRETGAKLT